MAYPVALLGTIPDVDEPPRRPSLLCCLAAPPPTPTQLLLGFPRLNVPTRRLRRFWEAKARNLIPGLCLDTNVFDESLEGLLLLLACSRYGATQSRPIVCPSRAVSCMWKCWMAMDPLSFYVYTSQKPLYMSNVQFPGLAGEDEGVDPATLANTYVISALQAKENYRAGRIPYLFYLDCKLCVPRGFVYLRQVDGIHRFEIPENGQFEYELLDKMMEGEQVPSVLIPELSLHAFNDYGLAVASFNDAPGAFEVDPYAGLNSGGIYRKDFLARPRYHYTFQNEQASSSGGSASGAGGDGGGGC